MSDHAGVHSRPNRLIHQTSPYLLQHAYNPVDWYAWGPEAFERARRENKPIFLSVGYSTCYWCHVMERQCFENPQIAELMNRLFVNIKVDREERPDVDHLYMLAVQIIARQGGWPMSVFLTPDLKPFFGGTYFPPQDMSGRPGFPRVLEGVADAFANRRDQVERSAGEIVRMIAGVSEPRGPEAPIAVSELWLRALVERCVSDYDPCCGGFSGAPKFPRQTLLELILAVARAYTGIDDHADDLRNMAITTLDAMADGGIHDQLGGGFHRYSTDDKWLVPHFEIMLYDNAMLAVCYAEAFKLTGDAHHAATARGILDFVLREMTSPDGAFYTAFDAEVDALEGASYLWTQEQIRTVLADFSEEDVELFLQVYGVDRGPNFADPHHGSGVPDQNILYLPVSLADVAGQMGLPTGQLDARLAPMRQALYDSRRKRKQPLLDTKILTSWNALMIRAMALVGKAVDEPRYILAAQAAARFLLTHHRLGDGTLIRTSRPDAPDAAGGSECAASPGRIDGTLDDYAFFAHALLALHEATGDVQWRDAAARTVATMQSKFRDPDFGAFYFTAADATDLVVRQKLAQDSPLPSGNSVAAMCLLQLGDVDAARQTLAVFAQTMDDQAEGTSALLQATLLFLAGNEPFTVSQPAAQSQRPVELADAAQSAVSLAARWRSPTQIVFTLAIATPYHLHAHPAPAGLVGTSLSLALPAGTSADIEYPPGTLRQLAFAEEPLRVYEETVEIAARLDSTLPPGTVVRAALSFQACTEDACLMPAKVETQTVAP